MVQFYSAAFWKYKIMSWKKKEFEDLEDLLVSFRLYFIIAEDSLCISTIMQELESIRHPLPGPGLQLWASSDGQIIGAHELRLWSLIGLNW
jgi:hypothetical protein